MEPRAALCVSVAVKKSGGGTLELQRGAAGKERGQFTVRDVQGKRFCCLCGVVAVRNELVAWERASCRLTQREAREGSCERQL